MNFWIFGDSEEIPNVYIVDILKADSIQIEAIDDFDPNEQEKYSLTASFGDLHKTFGPVFTSKEAVLAAFSSLAANLRASELNRIHLRQRSND